MKILLILPLVVLTGCASLNPPPEYYAAQAERVKASAALAQKPMLTMSCTAGCTATMYDPRAAASVVKVDQGTTTADVAIKALGVADSVLTSGIIAYGVKEIMQEVGDKNFSIDGDGNTFQQDYHANQLTDISGSQDNSSIDSNDVRGDEYVGDKNNNSGGIDRTIDNTHEPTVVNQPPVTVVTTPGPEVIQVPAGSNTVVAPTDKFEVVQ